MTKICSKCNKNKTLDSFAIQVTGKLGRRADCKICVKRFTRSQKGLIKSIYFQQKSKARKRNYQPPSYTELELFEWVTAQPQFNKLYTDWVNSNYATSLRPSIDRINDYISYTLSNIQLITHQENINNFYRASQTGINTKKSIAIDQLDLEGNFIKRFHSINAAANELNVGYANIANVCRGKPISKIENGKKRTWIPLKAYGFKWRYSIKPNINEEIK